MDTFVLITSALVAASVTLILVGVRRTAQADVVVLGQRLGKTRRASRRESTPADVTEGRRDVKFFSALDRPLERFGWAERARKDLRQAEVRLHLSEFIILRLATSATAVFLVAWVFGTLLAFLGALILGAAVWAVPGYLVRKRIAARRASLEGQLDSMLTAIASSLRSGFSFLQACQLALEQLEWPLKGEMEEMLEDVSLGASIDEALVNLGRRVESYEVDITVNAVLVHRQTGGNLSEVLEHVARTIRERRELKGHIMALTAQQRLSAVFVAGVPVFMAAFLSATNWEFMKPLWTTTVGNVLLAVGCVFDVLGFIVMRRLTRIDF